MKAILPLLFLGLSLCIACKKKSTQPDPPPPTEGPDDILAKGVNLSNWFNDYSDAGQFNSRFPFATLQLAKSNGFTYVRLPVGSTILFNAANPSQLNSTNLVFVDAAVSRCLTAGLGVTINIHSGQNDMDIQLANDPSFVDKVAAYWKALAGHFKKYPASKMYFEVYNEPHASAAGLTTQGFDWWQPAQEKIIKAIREATADHYIIVGGEGWNSINGLKQLMPYNYDRIIYNFHFYDPFLFTHQGASWTGWQVAMDARNVPYPASPEGVAPLIAATSNTELKNNLQWYGSQRYNIDSIDKWIKVAYDWAKAKNVKLISNEFGSFKPYAPRQSRLNFIKDVRTVYEKYKIGWAMWECDEDFGWITYPGGNRSAPVADNEVLQALGLK